jgi:hypothetical protein
MLKRGVSMATKKAISKKKTVKKTTKATKKTDNSVKKKNIKKKTIKKKKEKVAQNKQSSPKKIKHKRKVAPKETIKTHGPYAKVCPECGSLDVEQEKDNPLVAEGLPERWVCQRCGHSAYIFPEVALNKIPEFQNIMERNMIKDDSEKVDVSYGRFETQIIWKLTGPLLFIVGLVMLFLPETEKIGIFYPYLIMGIGIFMVYIAYNAHRKYFRND